MERNFAVYGSAGTGGSSIATNYAVYGEAQDPGFGGTYYAGFFDGDVTVTGTFTNPSDKKLKENIEPEKNVLEQIEKLNPVVFQFKNTDEVNLPTGLQHGFIAQELEKIFPELVKEVTKPVFNEKGEITGNTSFKSVNYIGMISILAQSVKELNAKVGQLEKSQQTYVVLNNSLSAQELENLEGKIYSLEQNNPNPFNKQTIISYKVPENDKSVTIMIFDMTGNLLKKYELDKPEGSITISASELHQGIFLYSLVSHGREVITKKMIVEY
ncbi:MAG TPA: tail fiber domain-containing protein [Flavobacteriaceae bacterium]|nr:tail fiber domain-containing protein [Flavobacteriaceae bacterium]